MNKRKTPFLIDRFQNMMSIVTKRLTRKFRAWRLLSRKYNRFKHIFNKKYLLASIAIIIISLAAYALLNTREKPNITLNEKNTISSQPNTRSNQPINQPINQPSSSVYNYTTQKQPIVPDWAKKKSDFILPVHQSKWDNNQGISYYPDRHLLLKPSNELTAIVKNIIKLIKNKKLTDNNLSITLIDANKGEIGEYQKDKLMFPASIAKMFWLVTLQGQIQAKMWNNPEAFDPFIDKMMKESDNDSSSFIIDNITGSYSSNEKFDDKILEGWLRNRQFRINAYFQAAAYNPNINITQKTYPIPYIKLSEPKGNELQIRENQTNPDRPIRNSLSSFDAARLMYEICYKKEAVSKTASNKACSLLERKVDRKEWSKIKPEDFNPIQSFFGESLPSKNIKFYSKAGWTPKSRSEVCMVEMLDRKKSYILAIFADDPSFGKDNTIFPAISKLVYSEIHTKSQPRLNR
jgi:Beta-lactamase enzyme family